MENLKRITFNPEVMGGEAMHSGYESHRRNDRRPRCLWTE